jgi:hypothetical protein
MSPASLRALVAVAGLFLVEGFVLPVPPPPIASTNSATPTVQVLQRTTQRVDGLFVPVVSLENQLTSLDLGAAAAPLVDAAAPLVNEVQTKATEAAVEFLGGQEYWEKGRGKEVLGEFDRWKENPQLLIGGASEVIKSPVNSFVANVKGYWSQGRGKEILDELRPVLEEPDLAGAALDATTRYAG